MIKARPWRKWFPFLRDKKGLPWKKIIFAKKGDDGLQSAVAGWSAAGAGESLVEGPLCLCHVAMRASRFSGEKGCFRAKTLIIKSKSGQQ